MNLIMSEVGEKYSTAVCVVCLRDIKDEKSIELGSKGLDTMVSCASSYGDKELHEYLLSAAVVKIHDRCRKRYTDARNVKKATFEQSLTCGLPVKKLRSSTGPFVFKRDCLYCGCIVSTDHKHRDRDLWFPVRTLELRDSILGTCESRCHDDWAMQVATRVRCCNDLVAEESLYHKKCHDLFHLGKPLAAADDSFTGRPVDEKKQSSFYVLCDWLEQQTDRYLYSVTELHEKLIAAGYAEDDVYSVKALKLKLQDHYGTHVVFAEQCGRHDVVCLTQMASFILQEQWKHETNVHDNDAEAVRIVKAAGKLIRAELREFEYNIETYPTEDDIRDQQYVDKFIPPLLKLFMQLLVTNSVKHVAISNAVVQAARPRSVISPILFGVGVQMDHAYGSKWLIDELARLGFSVSSAEVYRFKQSVMRSDVITPCCGFNFTQWVGDNVDHNVASLDGRGSFHGMGVIAVSSGKQQPSVMRQAAVIRIARQRAHDGITSLSIPIRSFNAPDKRALASVVVRELRELQQPESLVDALRSDLLWASGWVFQLQDRQRPNWSGFMQHVYKSPSTEVSNITLLPIIDMNPSDSTCIYSVLCFVESQAKLLNIDTACVTFDQPLWMKAVEIVQSTSLKVFCRLGGFHMIMSYIGSIGSVMAGSGLEEALAVCYGSNTVTHMLSGKAISRALRGFFLVDGALSVLLLENLMPDADADNSKDRLSCDDLTELAKCFREVMEGTISIEVLFESHHSAHTLEVLLQSLKVKLAEKSRTANLWLQFMNSVEIVRLFIRAERLSDWSLHVYATSRMLSLFAASGHFNYAKSTRLYLQMMQDLPDTYPWLYEQFSKYGYHCVRRSDRAWSGIWTDLAIEQLLMRALKNRGGLTRGRGFSESVRLTWIYTMHRCAGIHQAMTDVTGLVSRTSEQHAEFGKSRLRRDMKDQQKMISWFEQHNPFIQPIQELCSLSTGLTTTDGDGVNCDNADAIGTRVQKQMDGCMFGNVSMKKKDCVKSLLHLQKGVTVDSKVIPINCGTLFTRLVVLVERQTDMEPYFKYELTPVPASLFKDSMLRKPDKAALSKLLSKNALVEPCFQTHYVLDGGALLYRVPWNRGVTYGEVVQQYVRYVLNKYGRNVSVVFDGYRFGPSTKDHEHVRRSSLKMSATVTVSCNIEAHVNPQAFLANTANKDAFIVLLIESFQANGLIVTQASGDADTLVVNTALQLASTGHHATVVADDTDILVLLVYHWKPSMAPVFMKREPRCTFSGHMVSIPLVVNSLGEQSVSRLLTIHALSGCDTTSALYGHGKASTLKKLSTDSGISHLFSIMNSETSSTTDVGQAGSHLVVLLYGGRFGVDSLNHLRYTTYMRLCTTSKGSICPEQLPPTERAVYFHSLRVHLQVIQWQCLSTDVLAADEWGWELSDGKFLPVKTDQPAAPDDLLRVIRCRCKVSARNTCGSNVCSCRRNGLKCLSACSDCHGNDCLNCEQYVDVDDSSSEDEQAEDKIFMEDDLTGVVDEEVVCFDDTERCSYQLSQECMDIEQWEDDDVPWYNEETVTD